MEIKELNTFEIAVSNDGNTFTKIFSSKSSGTTTAAEKYDVTDSQGRYVKITVTGNTQSDWVSIKEIDVIGGSASSSDTTKPTVTSTSPGAGTATFKLILLSRLTFSEPMLSSSVSTNTFTLRIADTTNKAGRSVSLSSDGKTATFNPPRQLDSST